MPDFSLLQNQDFGRAALGGYQAGAALGKQRRLDAAMSAVDLDRPETLVPLLHEDPATGAALIGASIKMHAENRAQAALGAQAAYIKSVMPGAAGQAPTGVLGGSSVPSPAPVGASPDVGNDIVVNAPRPAANPNAARDAAIDADPQAFLEMQSKIGAMGKTQRDALADAAEAQGTLAQQALGLPYAQRKAFIATHTGYLAQHGVKPEDVEGFDPTDDNLHAQVGQAIGVKGILEQRNKEADDRRADEQFAETKRSHQVSESQGASRIGLEAQSVGISAGHLALDRAKEGRVAAAGTSATAAAIPSPTSKAAYDALRPGTRYRAPDGSVRVKN